ncbi:MAG: DNA repair protein RecN [Bacteroidia bacterium]|nr:DNA repair protein RecN [Bacteroidia bacterium]MDW8158343.1 DNA repair protein RecN [Bacteroidia bacterium]
MLSKIFIQNYALIEKVEIEFSQALNILTGETGAGKSILLGAIGLILGKRADASVILDPEQKCIVEAEFWVKLTPEIIQILEQAEIEPSEHIILRREISPNGKSRAFINDTPANLNTLRSLTSIVVDLHSQHEGIQLMQEDYQLNILDQYAGLQNEVSSFAESLTELRKIDKKIQDLRQQEAEAKRQIDYYRFQVEELRKANLSIEEEEQIEQDLMIMQNAEQIREVLLTNINTLYESDLSVTNQLASISKALEKIASLSPDINEELQKLEEASYLIADAVSGLQRIADLTEYDPSQLATLSERQSVYNRLKLKYGVRETKELLALQQEFEQKLGQFESIDEDIADLEKQKKQMQTALVLKGLEIEAARKQAAIHLANSINQSLKEVGLSKAEVQIAVERLLNPNGLLEIENQKIQPDSKGINQVRFMIRTNEGLPMGPLSAIASGGELSRVLLAIKTALAEKMQLAVLIFDEIDTGISGEVAMKVGKVMEKIAQKHQIITITHLPQIASRKAKHFFIYKQIENGRTYSRIRVLSTEERVYEIAKMMSGENPSSFALQSAGELINN